MNVPISSRADFRNQIAVITGGSGGIGLAVAKSLEARGATVVILDLLPPDDHSSENYIDVDVSSYISLQDAITEVLQRFARVDIAIGCAGVVSGLSFEDFSEDEANRIIDVNFNGFVNLLRAVIPPMCQQKSGKIVALGSVATRVGGVQSGPAYIGAKAAVTGVVKWAAKTYGSEGIHVNAVAPGPILTPMWQGLNDGELVEDATGYPLGRLGRPEDIAEPIIFLAGSESNWITGQTLDINGGSYFS